MVLEAIPILQHHSAGPAHQGTQLGGGHQHLQEFIIIDSEFK